MKKLLVILLVLGLAAPVMAAEWNMYGSARMATFWVDFDAEDLDDVGVADDDGLQHALQGNSRIGANVKVNDQIGGRFEFGVNEASVTSRLLYGTYNFGAGKLLIGKDYTPGSFFYSNSVFDGDGDLLGVGQFYGHRYGQAKLMMGGFSVALVTPVTSAFAADTGYTDVDVSLPKIEAAYSFKSDVLFFDVFGGYQTYEVENADEDSVDVDSYVIGANVGAGFGPVKLTTGASFAQNIVAYQPVLATRSVFATALAGPVLDGDDTEDGETLQAFLVANFKVSDTLAFEAGVGYAKSENDAVEDAEVVDMQYYVNAVVTIAPGFFIVPEVGMLETDVDFEDDDADAGQTTYVGLKWQINF
jgi:hypothetical protein